MAAAADWKTAHKHRKRVGNGRKENVPSCAEGHCLRSHTNTRTPTGMQMHVHRCTHAHRHTYAHSQMPKEGIDDRKSACLAET